MIFWMICATMSVLVVAILGRALLRQQNEQSRDAVEYDLGVYRDQLADVERDVARGVLGAEDAERTRTEISRRILAADAGSRAKASTGTAPGRPLVIVIALAVIGGSLAVYAQLGQPGYGDLALADRIAFAERMRENRPDQQTAVDSLPPFTPLDTVTDEFRNLMAQLRETVANRPTDLQGNKLLAENEARIGNFAAAADAQEQVLRIKGDAATAQDITDFGELLVLAAGGYVSPEAEVAFRAALTRDETEERARYYLGLMMVQTGRPDIGFRLWDALLRRGPEDAAWIAPILSQIEEVAYLAGVNYTVPAIGAGAAPVPRLRTSKPHQK
ncbi:c-type cytochrome biogenesis protein CcmI [Sulfitobacter pacificus]|uniref:c-type cytochrome biogenesis protein CcmI n=1 Tax=Sulfitobacter pacificus TaxID=1499314 RepID=UPI0036183B24